MLHTDIYWGAIYSYKQTNKQTIKKNKSLGMQIHSNDIIKVQYIFFTLHQKELTLHYTHYLQ